MAPVDVIAVVGTCVPEREAYAQNLARATGWTYFPSARLLSPILSMSPDPLDEAVALAPWAYETPGAVIGMPTRTRAEELIGTFAEAGTEARLVSIVCVADVPHLLDDLHGEQYVTSDRRRGRGFARDEHPARAALTVTDLEFASTTALVNWEMLPTAELARLMALISALAPSSRLQLFQGTFESPAPQDFPPEQERPGWVALMNEDHHPAWTDRHVDAVHYEQVRPLHPGRLQELLDARVEAGEFGTLIRSAGFCRFATRPHEVLRWEHVGNVISFVSLTQAQHAHEGGIGLGSAVDGASSRTPGYGVDESPSDDAGELLALGQDLALIGIDLDVPALTSALDEVALTDEELTADPAEWAAMPDPFPVVDMP
jgi:G3E family GTPase